jgi:hypothetical protein
MFLTSVTTVREFAGFRSPVMGDPGLGDPGRGDPGRGEPERDPGRGDDGREPACDKGPSYRVRRLVVERWERPSERPDAAERVFFPLEEVSPLLEPLPLLATWYSRSWLARFLAAPPIVAVW